MKNLHFIVGLPRSGSTMITNILKQNPEIHGESVSSLSQIFSEIFTNWNNIEANKENPNNARMCDVLKGVIEGYYESTSKPIIFDKNRMWISKIPILESISKEKVKMLVCVRNPAEILASFEKIKRDNPTVATATDMNLGSMSTIASRAMFYSGPDGAMGIAHTLIKDALTMGYMDRLLFVEYNRFCNTPKSQMARIYKFFEIESFEHDFDNIEQDEVYNDFAHNLPNLHKIKPKVDRTTVNPVDYLGLDLFQQYNSQIFWDALI